MYLDAGRLSEARTHYQRAIELRGEMLGHRHPVGAHPLAGLGDVELREGVPHEAMRDYDESLKIMEASYGPDHLYLIHPLSGLGYV